MAENYPFFVFTRTRFPVSCTARLPLSFKNQFNLNLDFCPVPADNLFVLCQWQENLQRLPLSPPGKSAVLFLVFFDFIALHSNLQELCILL